MAVSCKPCVCSGIQPTTASILESKWFLFAFFGGVFGLLLIFAIIVIIALIYNNRLYKKMIAELEDKEISTKDTKKTDDTNASDDESSIKEKKGTSAKKKKHISAKEKKDTSTKEKRDTLPKADKKHSKKAKRKKKDRKSGEKNRQKKAEKMDDDMKKVSIIQEPSKSINLTTNKDAPKESIYKGASTTLNLDASKVLQSGAIDETSRLTDLDSRVTNLLSDKTDSKEDILY